MALDAKYQNNIVLTKDAYQDLLTNIKNYPIIDIDYVTEDEEDELHGDKIWQGYTDDIPCIKITYGNERETKGNIIFSEEKRKRLREIQKELNRLKALLNKLNYQYSRWMEVWAQNKKIEQAKIDQANKLANNLVSLDESKYDFLIQAMDLLTSFSNISVYNLDENSFNGSGINFDNAGLNFPEYFTYVTEELEGQTPGESIRVTFKFLNDTAQNLIKIDIQKIRDQLYGEETTEENVAQKACLNNFIDFIDKYNTLIFMEGISTAKPEYQTGTDVPLSILQYLDFTNYNPSYNFNNLYNQFKNNIQQILSDILNKVQTNLTVIRSKLDVLNEQINWLKNSHTPASSMTFDGKTENKSIGDYETEITQINQEIEQAADESGHKIYGYKYVKVGSNITFDDTYFSNSSPYDVMKGQTPTKLEITPTAAAQEAGTASSDQTSGTFRITINKHIYEVPIKGFTSIASNQPIYLTTTNDTGVVITSKSGDTLKPIVLDGNVEITGNTTLGDTNTDTITVNGKINSNILPDTNNSRDLGSSSLEWANVYTNQITIGSGENAIVIGGESGSSNNNPASAQVLGKSGWTNNLIGPINIGNQSGSTYTANFSVAADGSLVIKNTTEAHRYTSGTSGDPNAGNEVSNINLLTGSIKTLGGIAAGKSIKGSKVHGAVFNDYAEYRHTENIEPGRCVIETGEGDLILSTKRLQLGANIVSDTFGFSIGETNYANTPIAVCGRVLVYTYEDRNSYKPGEAVCSAPDGTVSRMHRDEIRNWPDAIVGYVSEIPQYEKWGTDQIDVNGRIWIKVK